jgi:PIN domain nuclease of toxin-antitoxin system
VRLLLDTCVVLFLVQGKPLRPDASKVMRRMFETVGMSVSLATAWELGKLASSRRLPVAVDPLTLFTDFVGRPGIDVCDLTYEILIKSSFLPELRHKDPMDLLLIATARLHDFTLVTRDRAILEYGAAGHIKTLEC